MSHILASLQKKEQNGELYGYMHMVSTCSGNKLVIEGSYAQRLQYAAYTLQKALNEVMDKIVETGAAGYSSVSSMDEYLPPKPPPQLPPRLKSPRTRK